MRGTFSKISLEERDLLWDRCAGSSVGMPSSELCSSSFEKVRCGRADPDAEPFRGRGVKSRPMSSKIKSIRWMLDFFPGLSAMTYGFSNMDWVRWDG